MFKYSIQCISILFKQFLMLVICKIANYVPNDGFTSQVNMLRSIQRSLSYIVCVTIGGIDWQQDGCTQGTVALYFSFPLQILFRSNTD